MTFNLQQLRAFVTIVEKGSLGRAAETLYVTQPALSRTIHKLEEEVGAPLFERHSKGMQLTAIGSALLPHATLLQRGAEHAREEIDAIRGLAKGTIRVGAVASIASHVLPEAVGRVLASYPNLRAQIIEGVWDRLADGLVTREIDLALSLATQDTDEIVAIADCTWHDTSHIVASLDHPLRRHGELDLADARDAFWCVPPRGTPPHDELQQLFASRGLEPPEITVETRSITMLKSLVTRSHFLCWMAEPMYMAERAAGAFDALPVRDVQVKRTLTAFRRREGSLPGPALKLLDALRSMPR